MSDTLPKNTGFARIVERAISRRDFLHTSASIGVASFVTATASSAVLPVNVAQARESPTMDFEPVPATGADTITVPPGYQWQTVISWGDPLFSKAQPFDQTRRGTAANQEMAFGDNNDGMMFYPLTDDHGVLVVNNEFISGRRFSPPGTDSPEQVRKGKAGVGVSIVELRRSNGIWQIVLDGKLNRRITADSPMQITGPARGHDLMKTAAEPSGTASLGTWANCGSGTTPWGTYLTCEENFNAVFGTSNKNYTPTAAHKRYGLRAKDRGYNWYKHDARFDISKHPNEANRCGYVVEIDPMDPTSTPSKRTALGRFKHENAAVAMASDGRVVVYMGDDARGEYLYRFVSQDKFQPGKHDANRNLLEQGTLFVARFGPADSDLRGRGQWIALTHGENGLNEANGFGSQAEIAIHTRQAATRVAATTMDRPEWVAVHPHEAHAYCSLTNNTDRAVKPNAGGAPTPVNGPNPRASNAYGQIVRWRAHGNDHAADTFDWDLFVLAGNPSVHSDRNAGSKNVNIDNMFNSPDGLAFDADGRLWIQTDGNYTNTGDFAGMGNNQMLCANPITGEIRRFLVGPVACEVTGVCWSGDRTTMFVGIQHPGTPQFESHFPDGGTSVPRSSVVAVSRKDGGVVGT